MSLKKWFLCKSTTKAIPRAEARVTNVKTSSGGAMPERVKLSDGKILIAFVMAPW